VSGDPPAWRTFAIDSERRRLIELGATSEYADPNSGPTIELESLEPLAGWEMEHVPTGLRISMVDRWGEPIETLSRLSEVPRVLREAADRLGPHRRPGPRRGPVGGWVRLQWSVATLWLAGGRPPTQEQVAEDLEDYQSVSSLARAVRPMGWESVLVVSAWILRRWQRALPEPQPDEPDALTRRRRLFDALDLTGF
jgi:hypothetical protein